MSVSFSSSLRRVLVAAALTVTMAACGANSSQHAAMPSGMNGGMASMPTGDGLTDSSAGYRLATGTTQLTAAMAATYRFTVTGPDGKPVTDFAVDQTQRLHFYAIRSDLTGFQHVHPVMAPDGTWTASLGALTPGSWRLFATFTPNTGTGKGKDFVLSRTVTVPGGAATSALPAAAADATADGYTVAVRGELMAGMAHQLTVTVSKDGKPVTDLQPYLDTYAHLTAFHAGDLAFAHLHPATTVNGDHGGPELSFHAMLGKPGDWRLFLQFRAAGTLHTAALTLRVN